jgi:hypothetical protein
MNENTKRKERDDEEVERLELNSRVEESSPIQARIITTYVYASASTSATQRLGISLLLVPRSAYLHLYTFTSSNIVKSRGK